MNKLIIGILFLAGCVQTGPGVRADIPDLVVDWSEANVWYVDSPYLHGTSFFVTQNTLVTACHVAAGGTDENGDGIKRGVIRNFNKSQVLTFSVVSCNEEFDIAILRVNPSYPITVYDTELRRSQPKTWTTVYGVGYPMQIEIQIITQGHWAGKNGKLNEYKQETYIVTTPIILGDSGGPVVIVENGRVVIVGARLAVLSLYNGHSTDHVLHLAVTASSKQILKVIGET